MKDISLIRNVALIAHIDHGKSTLADRFLEITGTVPPEQMREQFLDRMDLERERGITIKATAVQMRYKARDGREYEINLIDTPGHVDFSYEVSRSLAACEGAVLIVDATQGVEAQTIAHAQLAKEQGLVLVPVINKIDLPAADPERVREQLLMALDLDPDEALEASAKFGWGVEEVLEAIVKRIPPPRSNPEAPLRALIFDSHFDTYKGVVVYVRVVDGIVKPGMRIRMMSTGAEFEVDEVGVFKPDPVPVPELMAGEVGYITAGIREIRQARVGDTITDAKNPASEPLPGYRRLKPMVFASIYPEDGEDWNKLREALEKLQLNDAALTFQPERSPALGAGFRCGFLGLLHMEVVQERLEREFEARLVITSPSVVYRIVKRSGEVVEADSPAKVPPTAEIEHIEEPWVRAMIVTPEEFVGPIIELCQSRRGEQVSLEYTDARTVKIVYDLPLAEVIFDFFDALKSVSRGYASLDYEPIGYRRSDIVKLTVMVNNKPVDALSVMVHRSQAYQRGRAIVRKLKELIPRQLFEIKVQAAIDGKVIASERIPPLRKDVLAKCYGGDVTRKMKLLEKQREGKKRLKAIGKVEIPQEAFISVLKVRE